MNVLLNTTTTIIELPTLKQCRCRICMSAYNANNLQLLVNITIAGSNSQAKLVDFIEKIINIQFSQTTLICQQCVAAFSLVHSLAETCIRSENSYNEQEITALELDDSNKEKQMQLTCTECDKVCSTKQSFAKHMKTHLIKKKTFHCDVCNKEFLYQSMLTEHYRTHTGEKPFLCPICGKAFRQTGNLGIHVKSHSGVKIFKCEVCAEDFVSSGTLKVHMRIHTGERPYVCDMCGKSFRQSTDMKRHRLSHQPASARHTLCVICGKKYTTTGQLTVHMRSHTGEKPYRCSTCNKAFITRTMLVKHTRIHTGEKPYECNICQKQFNQSSTLNRHLKTHNVKDLQYNNSNFYNILVTDDNIIYQSL